MIRRRRECAQCGVRFSTFELVNLEDGSITEFLAAQLLHGQLLDLGHEPRQLIERLIRMLSRHAAQLPDERKPTEQKVMTS